jgi:hypothetical protein
VVEAATSRRRILDALPIPEIHPATEAGPDGLGYA